MNNERIVEKLNDPIIRHKIREKVKSIIDSDIEEKDIIVKIHLDKNFAAIYELVKALLSVIISDSSKIDKHIFYRGLLGGIELFYQYEELYKDLLERDSNE